MRTQKNTTQLMIAGSYNATASQKLSDLAANELGIMSILDASGSVASGTMFDSSAVLAAGDVFKMIIKRSDGSVDVSDDIAVDNVVAASLTAYSAPTEQIDYIGYDATNDTGSIDVINSNPYYASFLLKGSTMASFAEQERLYAIYTSDATATQYEIAAGLAKTAIENMRYLRKNYKPLQFDVVCDETGTEALGAADTFVGYKDSNTITIVESGGDLPYLFAVGDFIRVGTADTTAVYKITATTVTVADGGVLTLDRKLNADISVTGTGNVVYITAAEGAAANWGLKITGVTADVIAGYVNKDPVRFESAILDAGDTSLSRQAVTASRGIGSTDYVKQLEAELQGTRGIVYRGSPQYELPRTSYATIDTTGYDILAITYKKVSKNMISGPTESYAELLVALDSDLTTTDLSTMLAVIL